MKTSIKVKTVSNKDDDVEVQNIYDVFSVQSSFFLLKRQNFNKVTPVTA